MIPRWKVGSSLWHSDEALNGSCTRAASGPATTLAPKRVAAPAASHPRAPGWPSSSLPRVQSSSFCIFSLYRLYFSSVMSPDLQSFSKLSISAKTLVSFLMPPSHLRCFLRTGPWHCWHFPMARKQALDFGALRFSGQSTNWVAHFGLQLTILVL